MRATRALICVALAMGVVSAQRAAEPRPQRLNPDEGVKRVVVKRYTTLGAEAVWQAAGGGVRADVRFADTFVEAVPVSPAMRLVQLGQRRVLMGRAFKTESDLWCLVPRDLAEQQLTTIRSLMKGQSITVEGTIVGIIAAHRCVLVDMVLVGSEEASTIDYQLALNWPGRQDVKPNLIIKPGEYQVEFPCQWQKGAVEKLTLLVQVRERARFMEQLKELEGAAGTEESKPKVYDLYKPEAILEHARENHQLNVRFEEHIKGPAPRDARVASVRLRGQQPVRIGYALDTYTGIVCMIPAREVELVDRASMAISGQQVAIKGTIVGQVGAYRVVLVDDIDFPSLQGAAETPHVWAVQVFWADAAPMLLWKPGTYTEEFPCQFVKGRTERVVIALQEVRLIKEKQEGEGARGEQPAGAASSGPAGSR